MKYAPIIIPTLNRKKHLERCINSLKRNRWAGQTDLIISVDFPPNQEYEKGYWEVCEYLKQSFDEFHVFEVFYQKRNLGVIDNGVFLENYISSKYDRYIFLEDDNELAPNFIEYMDKGLELYESDENVLAVCASSISVNGRDSEQQNVFFTHNYGAYGVGKWVWKNNVMRTKLNKNYFYDICKKPNLLYQLYKEDISLVFALQDALIKKKNIYWNNFGELQLIDFSIKIYCYIENLFVVCPCTTKVRNYGYDGSGFNCEKMDSNVDHILLDTREHFEYKQGKNRVYMNVHRNYTLNEKIRFILAFIKLFFMGKRNKN